MNDATKIGLALGVQSAVLAAGMDGNGVAAAAVGGLSVVLSVGAVGYEAHRRSLP